MYILTFIAYLIKLTRNLRTRETDKEQVSVDLAGHLGASILRLCARSTYKVTYKNALLLGRNPSKLKLTNYLLLSAIKSHNYQEQGILISFALPFAISASASKAAMETSQRNFRVSPTAAPPVYASYSILKKK